MVEKNNTYDRPFLVTVMKCQLPSLKLRFVRIAVDWPSSGVATSTILPSFITTASAFAWSATGSLGLRRRALEKTLQYFPDDKTFFDTQKESPEMMVFVRVRPTEWWDQWAHMKEIAVASDATLIRVSPRRS